VVGTVSCVDHNRTRTCSIGPVSSCPALTTAWWIHASASSRHDRLVQTVGIEMNTAER